MSRASEEYEEELFESHNVALRMRNKTTMRKIEILLDAMWEYQSIIEALEEEQRRG